MSRKSPRNTFAALRLHTRRRFVACALVAAVLSASCNSRPEQPAAPQGAGSPAATKQSPAAPPRDAAPLVAPPQTATPQPPHPGSQLLPAVRQPVAWVIENGRAVQRSDARPIHDFELPTDINQPIDDSVLPQVFVTAASNRVVVRRGTAQFGFRDETIGEHCYPAYVCLNLNCPGKAEAGSPVLFPFRLLQKNGDACPHCLQTRDLTTETPEQKAQFKVLPYYMPQCRALGEIMLRQHYAKRAAGKQ